VVVEVKIKSMKMYKRFCCGIYYLLRDRARSTIPVFATFMFTLFLFMLVLHGIDSLIYLLFNTPYIFNKYVVYVLLAIISIPNYLFVFRNKMFLEHYREKTPSIFVILIVIAIFAGSIFLITQAGPRNLKLY
jgi:hypothetical protein